MFGKVEIKTSQVELGKFPGWYSTVVLRCPFPSVLVPSSED